MKGKGKEEGKELTVREIKQRSKEPKEGMTERGRREEQKKREKGEGRKE